MSKSLAVKKLQSSDFVKEAQVFKAEGRDHDSVAVAGERAFVHLYNGKKTDDLNKLRLVGYQQKLSSSTSQIMAKALPPTASAAKLHSYRVYLQV